MRGRNASQDAGARLPTRGPPQVAHVCVYQRVSSPLAALGLAPNEAYLGDVEVPLAALTDDEPLVQWLPLRNTGNARWFVRIKICLRFLLVALADDPDAARRRDAAAPNHGDRPAKLTSTFSDLGDAVSDAASEA